MWNEIKTRFYIYKIYVYLRYAIKTTDRSLVLSRNWTFIHGDCTEITELKIYNANIFVSRLVSGY